jgi:hypothetical protein
MHFGQWSGGIMALKLHERFPALGQRLHRHGLITVALLTALAWVLIIWLGWIVWLGRMLWLEPI